ncbi:hypothetical protein CMV_027464 [Castanea mollissima]|uniref:Uncharacterized protein n=1 Tax=Castanea mollissima TaxID=60419 RepID=A0A8J4QI70_9ROSI|nr:hypothetical protein CMV_027464 [Castanea mollissima]
MEEKLAGFDEMKQKLSQFEEMEERMEQRMARMLQQISPQCNQDVPLAEHSPSLPKSYYMALSIVHQIGAHPDWSSHFLYHTFSDTNSAETTETVSVKSVWKSSVSSLRYKVQKPDVDFSLSLSLSPCRLPVLEATQANISVACRASR